MSYRVKDYMDKTFATIDVDASIRDASKMIAGGEHSYIIVTERGAPRGMIGPKDIVVKIIAAGRDVDSAKTREAMSSPLITIDPDEDLLKASEIMQKQDVRRLAVVKGGIIYGVITAEDIAQRCGEYVDKSVKDVLRWSLPMR